MAYVKPTEFVKTMVDTGESKLFMATRDVLLRAFMACAILAIAVALAVTAAVQTGMLKNWGLIGLGNLLGALFSAVLIAITWTFAFSA